jgi:hypothetical protein
MNNSATEQKTSNDNVKLLIIGCGKKTLLVILGIISAIVAGGAFNLYAELCWNNFYQLVTINQSSLWSPLIAGYISIALCVWASCVANKLSDEKTLEKQFVTSVFLAILSGLLWFAFLCCACTVGQITQFESLHGYLLYAYILIWSPIVCVVVMVLSVWTDSIAS